MLALIDWGLTSPMPPSFSFERNRLYKTTGVHSWHLLLDGVQGYIIYQKGWGGEMLVDLEEHFGRHRFDSFMHSHAEMIKVLDPSAAKFADEWIESYNRQWNGAEGALIGLSE